MGYSLSFIFSCDPNNGPLCSQQDWREFPHFDCGEIERVKSFSLDSHRQLIFCKRTQNRFAVFLSRTRWWDWREEPFSGCQALGTRLHSRALPASVSFGKRLFCATGAAANHRPVTGHGCDWGRGAGASPKTQALGRAPVSSLFLASGHRNSLSLLFLGSLECPARHGKLLKHAHRGIHSPCGCVASAQYCLLAVGEESGKGVGAG